MYYINVKDPTTWSIRTSSTQHVRDTQHVFFLWYFGIQQFWESTLWLWSQHSSVCSFCERQRFVDNSESQLFLLLPQHRFSTVAEHFLFSRSTPTWPLRAGSQTARWHAQGCHWTTPSGSCQWLQHSSPTGRPTNMRISMILMSTTRQCAWPTSKWLGWCSQQKRSTSARRPGQQASGSKASMEASGFLAGTRWSWQHRQQQLWQHGFATRLNTMWLPATRPSSSWWVGNSTPFTRCSASQRDASVDTVLHRCSWRPVGFSTCCQLRRQHRRSGTSSTAQGWTWVEQYVEQRMGMDLQRAHQHRGGRWEPQHQLWYATLQCLLYSGLQWLDNMPSATILLMKQHLGRQHNRVIGETGQIQVKDVGYIGQKTAERIRGSVDATTWADAADVGIYNNEIEDYHRGNMDLDEQDSDWSNNGSTAGVKLQHPWMNGIQKQQRWVLQELPQLSVVQWGQQHPSTWVESNSDFQFNRRTLFRQTTSLINMSLRKVYRDFNT